MGDRWGTRTHTGITEEWVGVWCGQGYRKGTGDTGTGTLVTGVQRGVWDRLGEVGVACTVRFLPCHPKELKVFVGLGIPIYPCK